jgi:YgiT-type zinc finger domain-containing protein
MIAEQHGSQETCPVCGGPLLAKQVEKLLRGGVHTAIVKVEAEVCQRCGEKLYAPAVVQRFEAIRDKLARQETAGFVVLGQSFEASAWSAPATT